MTLPLRVRRQKGVPRALPRGLLRPRVGLGLLASYNLVKESPYSIVVVACVMVGSGYSQVDNQD